MYPTITSIVNAAEDIHLGKVSTMCASVRVNKKGVAKKAVFFKKKTEKDRKSLKSCFKCSVTSGCRRKKTTSTTLAHVKDKIPCY